MTTQPSWTFLRLVNRCLTNARKPKVTDVRDTNNPTFAQDAIEIIKEEYQEICSLQDWEWLRKGAHIATIGEDTSWAGTFTNDSVQVTVTTGTVSLDMKGLQLKNDAYEEVYEIVAVGTGGNTLNLDRVYTGTTVTDTGFTTFQNQYDLEEDFDRFIKVNKYFSNGAIELVGPTEFNERKYENRTYVVLQGAYQPRFATLVESQRIEIWPWPKDTQTYPYTYIHSPNELRVNDDPILIPAADITCLIHKAMVQIFGFLDDDDKANLAFSLWSNKYAEMSGSKTATDDVKHLKAYNRDRARMRRSRRGARRAYDYGETFDRTP